MARFVKIPSKSNYKIPFQQEVPPPSPSAGTTKLSPQVMLQSVGGSAKYGNSTGMAAIKNYLESVNRGEQKLPDMPQGFAEKYREDIKNKAYDRRTAVGAAPEGALSNLGADMNALGMAGPTLNPNLIKNIKNAITPNIHLGLGVLNPFVALKDKTFDWESNGSGQKKNALSSMVNHWENVLTGQGSKGDFMTAFADLLFTHGGQEAYKGGIKTVESGLDKLNAFLKLTP